MSGLENDYGAILLEMVEAEWDGLLKVKESGWEPISTSNCLLLDYLTCLGSQHLFPRNKYLMGTLRRDEDSKAQVSGLAT